MSYSLAYEFPDLAAHFDRLSKSDQEFAAQLASYYAVDARITSLSGTDAGVLLSDLADQRISLCRRCGVRGAATPRCAHGRY